MAPKLPELFAGLMHISLRLVALPILALSCKRGLERSRDIDL